VSKQKFFLSIKTSNDNFTKLKKLIKCSSALQV